MKYAIWVKLNNFIHKDYVANTLINWGETNVPLDKEDIFKLYKRLLEERGCKKEIIRIVFYYHNKTVFALRTQKPTKEELGKVNEKAAGLRSIVNYFGNDPRKWIKRTFNKPEELAVDPIARQHAEIVENPLQDSYIWKIKENLQMDFPDEADLLSYQNDFLDEDDKYVPPETKIEDLTIQTNNLELEDKGRGIKISTFDPETESVSAWIDNNVYSLELYGTRDEGKIIARLLNGLPENLLFAVRRDLQTSYPKGKNGRGENLTVEEFKNILGTHAQQTPVDLQRSLEKMSITGSTMNLREFYFKLMAILSALYPNTTNEEDKTKLVTQHFRQKLPANIRNSQILSTSETQGLELVKLAQRLMDSNKNSTTYSNKMGVGHGYRARGGFRGRGRGRGRGGFHQTRNQQNVRSSYQYNRRNHRNEKGHSTLDRDNNSRKNNDRRTSNQRGNCNFCGMAGHWQKDCYAYKKAKDLRREEVKARST